MFKNKNRNKRGRNRLYNLTLVLFLVFLIISHYPTIYGKDAFQVIWMANALKNGALFSENSWLISPLSYFGYFPFSHWPVGVPMVLAFLMAILEFVSLGVFGIAETIMIFDIILIIIIYKSAKNLANIIFKENWARFIFLSTTLLSQYILNTVIMTVSTRIVITIVMMILLNLNIQILKKTNKKFKNILFIFISLFIGLLAHRLWIISLISVIVMIFVLFIIRYDIFVKISIFFIIPLCIIAFFVGLDVLYFLEFNFLSRLDPSQTFSAVIDENSLLGLSVLLTWFYTWETGLIIIFFPIGVIITLYEIALSYKKKEDNTSFKYNPQLIKKYYLILFILPFSFLLPETFYSIVVFFPLLIIFSVYGIVYFKKYISNYSERLSWIVLAVLLSISTAYSFIKVEVSVEINLWFVYLLIFVSLFLILSIFLLKKYNFLDLRNITLDFQNLKKGVWNIILIISIIIFSITTIETNRAGLVYSPYPWENSYLTGEEIEIIKFFETEEINGLIFTIGITSTRFSGIGFLPAFHNYSSIGLDLWYNLISPDVVLQNTFFSFSIFKIFTLDFFEMNMSWSESNPLWILSRSIIPLNMTIKSDRNILLSVYNVQYLISVKEPYLKMERNWILTQSLFKSDLRPIFSTQHLLVWKIIG